MARSSDLVQATMFKALGDGFVFRVPRAWPFGSVRHYLVTEAQKAAIVERLMGYGTRSLLLALLIWVFLLGGIAVSIALLTGHDDPTLADVAVLVALAVPSLLACLQVHNRLTLQPLIVGLPETAERISYQERRAALRSSPFFRFPLLFGVFYSIACAANVFAFLARTHGAHRLTLGDGQSFSLLLVSVVFGLLAARFFYLEIVSTRPRGEAQVEPGPGPDADRVTMRLEGLELETRRLRLTLASVTILASTLGLAVVVLSGLVSGLTSSVDADRFVLRNSKGETAALLGVSKDDAPTLGLFGPGKKLRMLMGLTSTGSPQLGLYGAQEELRATVGLASDGLPVIRLNGADGKSRFAVVVNKDNSSVSLSEATGATRLSLSVDGTGGHLKLLDAAGKELRRE